MKKKWFLLAAAVVAFGCSSPPEGGDEWIVVELDDPTTADMGVMPDASPMPDVAEPEPIEPQTDGAACASDEECLGGTCLTGDAFPDGFCTSADCAGGCAYGSRCVESDELGSFCAPECDGESFCRDGYGCRRGGFRSPPTCSPIVGAPDGESCSQRSDCNSGFCMPWAGGYCTTFRCESSDQCANLGAADNICVADGNFNICLRRCTDAADCREGYICEDIGGGDSACVEDPARPLAEAVFAESALNVQCGIPVENGLVSFTYDIADTTTSYMVTPLARDGQPLTPRRIDLPDGSQRNFNGARSIFTVPASFFASMNPTLVPAGPGFSDMLAPGENTYYLEAEGEELCYYVVQKEAPGTVLDLNIYLVGVPNVTAATAGADPNFAAVFAEVSRIYEQVGITLGTLRFYDLDDEAVMRFGVLRSDAEVGELVKLSKPPGDDLQSLLSANVFFAGEFAMRGVIGISSGLPGPAGLHGTHGSGVVFTAEYMGGPVEDALGVTTDGNAYTGLLFAHEVGHWLGLFHTTEQGGAGHDPLGDTGECSDPSRAEACPDWGNVMFPFAAGANTNLTPDQGFVLSMNPLTHTDGGTP